MFRKSGLKLKRHLRGIIPPLVTPIRPGGEFDREGFCRLTNHVLAGGVQALFILGSTGESTSLGDGVKRDVILMTVEKVKGSVPILVGIMETEITRTIKVIDYCREVGVDGVVIPPPYYFPITPEEIYRFYRRVASSIDLPLLIYNIPLTTKLTVPPETLELLEREENIIGIKDSSGDMLYMDQILQRLPRDNFIVLMGHECLLAEAVLMGADGGVPSGANVAPRLFVDLYRAAEAGKLKHVREIQKKVVQLSRLYSHTPSFSGYLRGVKTSLELMGICSGELTEPFAPTTKEVRREIERDLKELGIL